MPLAIVGLAAFAAEVPFFFFGTASGHDVEFHLYSWLEVVRQWRQGIFYPRWAALAHFGFGEPRFLFYPPASWTLGAILTAIFPWKLVPEIYIWLALAGAGVSMFMLARNFLGRRDATFAAVLYALNPYHLSIIYWRSSFAELLASWLPPLLVLFVLRLEDSLERRAGDKNRRVILKISLVLAAAWLVNAPAAVMIHYSLALLLLAVAWRKRSPRILLAGSSAVILGAALAAFYLLPAIYEQRWVNIGEAISEGSRPLDNFLFVHTTDVDHNAFNRVISFIVAAQIILTMAAAWAARRWRERKRSLWNLLVIWAAACAMLMLPASNFLWNILPKLRFMQFPWRWTLCLGVPFALLTTMGIRSWWARTALYVAALCVLAFAWHHYQAPWWDTVDDLREMQDNMAIGAGYEGTDEYTPSVADASAVDKNSPRVEAADDVPAKITVMQWSAEEKKFTAQMAEAGTLVLHLFNYPAWSVQVNGRQVEASAEDGTGRMMIPLARGDSAVQVKFVRTWDRTLGSLISIFTFILMGVSTRFRFGLSSTSTEAK